MTFGYKTKIAILIRRREALTETAFKAPLDLPANLDLVDLRDRPDRGAVK